MEQHPPDPGQVAVLDTVQGASFLTIQDALAEPPAANVDPRRYKISVVQNGNSNVAVFTQVDEQAGGERQFGISPKLHERIGTAALKPILSDQRDHKVVDTLQGSSFEAIRAAVAVFERYTPDLRFYKITVIREKASVVVTFTDVKAMMNTRGNPGARPGYEVELDGKTLRTLRSNFIR